MNEDIQRYFDDNQNSWDAKVDIHKESSFYNLKDFQSGESSLIGPEVEELGNVYGRSLLHLQCHFGMDTISWVRKGAMAVGVDFSEKAIQLAKELNEAEENRAQFIQSNIYDLKQNLSGQFDFVFTSYGTIGWLPDLNKWAEVVANFLKPGGTFYIIDFHPVVWMLDDKKMKEIYYSYFNKEVISTEDHTYTDHEGTHRKFMTHGWNHPISEILNALLKQDLILEHFNEYDYSAYNCFTGLTKIGEHKWQFEGREGIIPMMYSIKMTK
ncbi:MAG: class I SAM-dependent methyltransferase [Bacteroidia bacterium]|nr:class I SAM-dependent methyltransferase [Bacteroidia bacterium]